MDTSIANPYQTPAAPVMEANQGGLRGVVPRFTAWAVFGLAVITLGIYSYYWLYSRTRLVNQRVDNPVGQGYMITTFVLVLCSWASNFVVMVSPEIGALLSLAGLAGAAMYIVWAFKLRNRLHQLQGIGKGHPLWAGPILTFFFNVIYLQYKINQAIDRENGHA